MINRCGRDVGKICGHYIKVNKIRVPPFWDAPDRGSELLGTVSTLAIKKKTELERKKLT